MSIVAPVRRARRWLVTGRPPPETDSGPRPLLQKVHDGGLDPSDVFVITEQTFGPQVVRKRTTDWQTYGQIFVREEYRFRHSVPPRTIIDLGANVGYATVWYHARYPEARIVAVEPEADNARTARINVDLACGNGGRVVVEETAIWHTDSYVKITNPKGSAWGFKVHEAEAGEQGAFRATTMSAIMDRNGMNTVDLVKIDIEAGERFLFAKNTEWLDRVNSIVIELHDRKVPGCREPVIAALDQHFVEYDEVVRGENTLFTRRHRLEELGSF
jgi:FkbM family methyltransferase